jgi:acetolactate synthase I/II/III large subunit
MTYNEQISTTAELLRSANRPLFVWGAGMRPYAKAALDLAHCLGVPIATTWGAIDLIHHHDPFNCGGFGTHGTKAANLAVSNCDLLISIGSRLDTKSTGTPSDFAPKAKVCMVDIDTAEIKKFAKLGRRIDIGITEDAGAFIEALATQFPTEHMHMGFAEWRTRIISWKEQYVPQGKAYDLMRQIGDYTTPDDIIVSDTGNTLGWIMQGFPFKGERFIHAFNFTPMGYGLAGAIGAAFASDRRVICIVGDGGALMSINELSTIARHKLNIKIILLNNGAHSMCMATQRQWLGGKYYATSIEGGLGFPDWQKAADAFGVEIEEHHLDPEESLAFQVKYGEPLA